MNGIIYGIKDLSSEKIIYIGSTNNFYMRKADHLCKCFTKQKDLLVYNYIRKKTDREHFDECFAFEELYSDIFENRKELRIIEEKFIEEKNPCCNQCKAFRTNEELKDYMRDYSREYYHKNEDRREYYREYQNTDKRRDYMREYMREYRRKKLAQESKN